MHNRFLRLAAAGAACLLLAGVALAASSPAPPEDVIKGKATYTQKLQEITQECDAAKAELWSRYRKTLDALRQEAKQKGDFDAVQAADAEILRFDKQKKMPPVTPPPANPDLAKAAKLCRDAMDRAEQDAAQKVIELTEHYLQFLELHLKQAVRDDKLDLAKAFDTELKTARETPAYQAAKFLIADKAATAETAKPDQPSEQPPAAIDPNKTHPAVVTSLLPPVLAPTRIGKDGEKIQPRIDPNGLYDAQRIFEGLPAATPGSSSSFKSLTVCETGKTTLSGIGIAMDGCLDTERAQYQSRIKLRSKSVGTTFVNLKILAQYFVKNQTGGAQEAGMQFTLVTNLSSKGTTCEMKPSDPLFPSVMRFRNGSFVQEREGSFLGVVVTVFSSDDKLLGQVSSSTAVKDHGRTTFELPDAWLEHLYDMPRFNPGAHLRRPPPANGN